MHWQTMLTLIWFTGHYVVLLVPVFVDTVNQYILWYDNAVNDDWLLNSFHRFNGIGLNTSYVVEKKKKKKKTFHMRTAKVQASRRIRAVSPEPILFAHVSGRPSENLSQRTGHVALLRHRACALKDWFEEKSEELFSSREGSYDSAKTCLLLIPTVPCLLLLCYCVRQTVQVLCFYCQSLRTKHAINSLNGEVHQIRICSLISIILQ